MKSRGSIIFEKMAASVFSLLIVILIMFLTYIIIPDQNREVILTLVGVITGMSAPAAAKLFGTADEQIDRLQRELDVLTLEYNLLKEQHMALTSALIRHHVIGDNENILPANYSG